MALIVPIMTVSQDNKRMNPGYKTEARDHCAHMAAQGRGAELLQENLRLLGIDLKHGHGRITSIGNERRKQNPPR